MTDTKYFSHSWSLLTRDKGWIKPILVLAVSMFVPVVGPLVVWGYALEWARLTAWNVDAAPKQRGVRIGACLLAGWRALVVTIVWALLWGIATAVVRAILAALGIRLLSELASIAIAVAELLLSLVIMVAVLRTTIYEKIAAGLNPVRVFEMVSRDAGGLFKNVTIPIVVSLIVGAIGFLGCIVLVTAAMPDIMQIIYEVEYLSASGSPDASMLISAVGSMLRTVLPGGVLVCYVCLVFSVAGNLLLTNAIGLWIRQFDVPRWGAPGDPLPPTNVMLPPAPAPVPPSPAQEAPAPSPAPVVPQPSQPASPVPTPAPTPAQPSQPVGQAPVPTQPQQTPDTPKPSSQTAPTPAPMPAATKVPPAGAPAGDDTEASDGDVVVPLTPPRTSEDGSKDPASEK